jgi:hypothetical protein
MKSKEPYVDAVNTVEDIEITQGQSDAGYSCPHCGKAEHTPNAVTLAAIQEAEAIAKGEVPGAIFMDPAQYRTREELKANLEQILQG